MSIAMRTIRLAAAATVLTLAASLVPSAAEAQTISACYTRKNGTMYRVGEPNTPADCTSTAHVKETWNTQGAPSAPGVSGYQIVVSPETISDSNRHTVVATCPAGKKVLGGGYINANSHGLDVISNGPDWQGSLWAVEVQKTVAIDITVHVYAICASVAP
jgi:hypothetical protein